MEAQQLFEVTTSCSTTQHHISEDLKFQFVFVRENEPNLRPACCSVTVPIEVPDFPLIQSVCGFAWAFFTIPNIVVNGGELHRCV